MKTATIYKNGVVVIRDAQDVTNSSELVINGKSTYSVLRRVVKHAKESGRVLKYEGRIIAY